MMHDTKKKMTERGEKTCCVCCDSVKFPVTNGGCECVFCLACVAPWIEERGVGLARCPGCNSPMPRVNRVLIHKDWIESDGEAPKGLKKYLGEQKAPEWREPTPTERFYLPRRDGGWWPAWAAGENGHEFDDDPDEADDDIPDPFAVGGGGDAFQRLTGRTYVAGAEETERNYQRGVEQSPMSSWAHHELHRLLGLPCGTIPRPLHGGD